MQKEIDLLTGLKIIETTDAKLTSTAFRSDEYIHYVNGKGICYEDGCVIGKDATQAYNVLLSLRGSASTESLVTRYPFYLEEQYINAYYKENYPGSQVATTVEPTLLVPKDEQVVFKINDDYIYIQELSFEPGYDYSILRKDAKGEYKSYDGGVYSDDTITIAQLLQELIKDYIEDPIVSKVKLDVDEFLEEFEDLV